MDKDPIPKENEIMKIIRLGVAALCLLSVICCSSHFDKPTSTNGVAYALGEISEDRSLYFTEAENYKEKSGGDLDFKGGASKGQCLGMRWGAKPTDFVTYDMDLKEAPESALLVLRVAFEGTIPQIYDVILDGTSVCKIELRPTGGYGYVEKEWKCYSAPIGRISEGRHNILIKPMREGEIVNIDCLVIGRAR
jgi:hypothetical protein